MTKQTYNSPPKDIGVIGHTVWFVFKLIGWVALSWLIVLFLFSLLLLLLGEKIGLRYLQALILSQLLYLAKAHGSVLLATLPVETAKAAVYAVKEELFIKTHFMEWLISLRNGPLSQAAETKSYLIVCGFYIKALMLVTELIVLRLMTAYFMLPLFGLTGIVGFIEGLVQRDIRKFSGGRESALLYHRAKRYIPQVLMAGLIIYLILPLPVPPQWLFIPTALLFGISIAVTVGRFKKYV